jgi:biopolymer transport protein ExbD
MPSKKSRKNASEIELQMTPMIDVTFLLLIFFMCSVRFKLLDGKLDTWLPRSDGVNANAEIHAMLERIEIGLECAGNVPEGFVVLLIGRRMLDLDQLCSLLTRFRLEDPAVTVIVRPGKGIEYSHVVATVNECLRAGLTSITFRGVPLDE